MTIIQTDKKYYKKMWSKENLDRVGCKSKNPEKYIVSMINSLGVPESNDVAIDIGCGRGRHTKILLDKGYTTFGMDFSINALKGLKDLLPSANILHSDITQIPLQSLLVDLVLDSGCLHHLDPSLYGDYTSEINRITKKGKFFILYQFKVRGDIGSKLDGTHFTKYFTEGELRDLFEKNWDLVHLNSVRGSTNKNYWIGLLQKR